MKKYAICTCTNYNSAKEKIKKNITYIRDNILKCI